MVRGVRGVVVVHVSSRFPGRASDWRRVARWIVAGRFTGQASPSRSAQPFARRQPRAPPLGDEFDGWGKLGAHHVGFLPAIGLRPRRNRRRKIPPERGVVIHRAYLPFAVRPTVWRPPDAMVNHESGQSGRYGLAGKRLNRVSERTKVWTARRQMAAGHRGAAGGDRRVCPDGARRP